MSTFSVSRGFSKRQACAVFICSVLFSHFVWANDCKELSAELDQMAVAQKVIMSDLVENHYKFANTMDDVADELALSSQKPSQKAIKGIKQTAKAFKKRGAEAKRLSEGLNEATEDLLVRVRACLRKS